MYFFQEEKSRDVGEAELFLPDAAKGRYSRRNMTIATPSREMMYHG